MLNARMWMVVAYLAAVSACGGGGSSDAPSTGNAGAPVVRKLYWRYTSNHLRALRDGNYKFLKMLDNTYLSP